MPPPGLILSINCGSSTVKYSLFLHKEGDEFMELCRGLVDRIGIEGSGIMHWIGNKKQELDLEIPTHDEGIAQLLNLLTEDGVIDSIDQIDAVGHRIVHGGESFTKSTLLDDAAIDELTAIIPLAPLHNPHNVAGILACKSLDKPQVGVFDTSFHADMPPSSYRYAIPKRYYTEHGIRRYGFHGISHQFVATEAAKLLGRPLDELKLITCHLGNGCSVTAIDRGRSIENTMGYTPLEGVVMGTRSGSIDPAIPLLIAKREGLKPQEVDSILNRESGLQGLGGSRDMRDIIKMKDDGDEDAILAMEVYCQAVVKAIGSYTALLDGVDAVVFTAGVGQNSAEVRARILGHFTHAGIQVDEAANGQNGPIISTQESRVFALAIPTNEELQIARETRRILS